MTAQLTAGIVNGKCPVTENCRCCVGWRTTEVTKNEAPNTQKKKCSLAVCASKKKKKKRTQGECIQL